MGKLDPVGKSGEESSSIVGGWSGKLLWEAYVPGVWYGAKVEHDEAKIQSSWVDNKKEKLVIQNANPPRCTEFRAKLFSHYSCFGLTLHLTFANITMFAFIKFYIKVMDGSFPRIFLAPRHLNREETKSMPCEKNKTTIHAFCDIKASLESLRRFK